MELPILQKLKDGEKFDFATLADNVEQTEDYWNWWWTEKAQTDQICRPEIIHPDDPILKDTARKFSVDLNYHREFFDKHLDRLLNKGILPLRDGLTRDVIRNVALNIMYNSSVKLTSRPQIIFAGGGYGSGKTTALNYLALNDALPVKMSHLVGVDVFKPLIPEYNLIKAVGDGRASVTVQNECKELANRLYATLIESGRSFAWDSSMSNKADTLEKIKMAKENHYEMMMVAVLTPMATAIKRAMHRAKQTRRFPNREALPESHNGFRNSFNDYLLEFDEISVLANIADDMDVELIAVKEAGKELVTIKPELLASLLVVPSA